MPLINLTLITPSGLSMDAEMPDDMTGQELIDDVLNQLNLPIMDPTGYPLKYVIVSRTLGRQLNEEETLATAKVPPGDTILLHLSVTAGGGTKPESEIKSVDKAQKSEGQVKLGIPSIGLQLDNLSTVDVRNLLTNESALMMTLHSYKSSLSHLEDSRQEVKEAEAEINRLNDRLKEKNIATILLILGQIQIGFGTNLITNGSTGGWFVFLSGLAINLGALYFSFFGIKRMAK
jgi:hypothetical protein